MNEKAKQLQLSNQTSFVNATGLADKKNEESQMTALDAAKLAQHLIKNYPNILEISKLTSFNLRGTTVNTTNKILYFQWVDGFKTGFTDAAGYCFTGTAKQDGKRMISVVMGTSNSSQRFIETKKLFSYGFDKFYIPFL